MAKVSIIVPVYNVENYLEECVNSLRNQTLQDVQIILVDDGSTDRSGKMIDEFAEVDNRIIALHKKNGGQSSARNLGFRYAVGEYILYVDSDDYLALDSCEILYKTAILNQADIVQGDLMNEKTRITEDLLFRKIPSENCAIPVSQFLKEKIQTQTYDIVPVLYFVRRELIDREQLSFPEGYTYEDQLYTFQLLTKEAIIVKVRFPFYFYRMDRPDSTTNHIVVKRGTDAAYICRQMFRYYLTLPKENEAENAAVIMISLYQLYNVFLKLRPSDRDIVLHDFPICEILSQLPDTLYYSGLHKELCEFASNPKRVVFVNDVKKRIRRILRRK